jgi:hypothetical protein
MEVTRTVHVCTLSVCAHTYTHLHMGTGVTMHFPIESPNEQMVNQ